MEISAQSPECKGFSSDIRNETAPEDARAQRLNSGEGSTDTAGCSTPNEAIVTDSEVSATVSLTDRQMRLAEIATRSAAVNARNHDLKMEYLVSAMTRDQIHSSR